MKRILSVLFALVVAGTIAEGQRTPPGCSNATLTGKYAFISSGTNAPGHSVTGKNTFGNAAVGVFTFDGAGNLTLSYTQVINGHASSTSVPDIGTYTVNPDCTGTMTDTTIDTHFNIVVIPTEIFGIETDEGFTATFDAKTNPLLGVVF